MKNVWKKHYALFVSGGVLIIAFFSEWDKRPFVSLFVVQVIFSVCTEAFEHKKRLRLRRAETQELK